MSDKIPLYIGIDVGGTNMRAALFRGQTSTPSLKIKRPTPNTREASLDTLESLIREAAGDDLVDVAGIGIAAPGPLNPHTGIVITAPNLPNWDNLPLKRLMEKRVGRPVLLGNDANLAALGEWKFGAGKGHTDVLYLTISTGIGGGVVVGNQLLLGAQGLGAEVGHVLAVPDGPLCGCGRHGCIEAVASGTAIGRSARQRLTAGEGANSTVRALVNGDVALVTSYHVGQAAQTGDAFALSLVTEAGHLIGRTLATLLHLFNPSVVVFGGGVSMLGDLLLNPVRESVQQHTMTPAFWQNCTLTLAALGDDAGLVGAGALAMQSGG